MGMTRMPSRLRKAIACAVLAGAICLVAPPGRADDMAAYAQRWKDLRQALFGSRVVHDGSAVLHLEAPRRAEDAALVPVTITTAAAPRLKGLYLIIDGNPSPLAAHFTFGPAADPDEIRLRVRLNDYTYVHAVAEMQDGSLYAVQTFVQAAGGCSAPAGTSEADALKGIGQMRLRLEGAATPGKPVQAHLLIRHPNFNGMQMNQLTRLYTPARFINAVDVTYAGQQVFHLDTDISMSTNPAITFRFVARDNGGMKVVARDSHDAVFTKTFEIPAQGS